MSRRILVVDDDATLAAHLRAALERLGYVVVGVVDTADDAERVVRDARPDLVLMDVQIRGSVDGIDTVARLRAHSDVPVVYLMSHSDEATLARARETLPLGYLVKPFDDRELRTTIEVALRKHEIERDGRRSARWFSAPVAAKADAVIATDVDGRIAYMNGEAERIAGVTLAEGRGKKVDEVLGLVDDRGSGFSVSIPPRSGVGASIEQVVVFRDVTGDRRELERAAQAERLASLGTMAARIAHEMNNPLAALLANVVFAIDEIDARSGGGALDAARSALDDARRDARRLGRIIQSLRALVPVPTVERAHVELSDVVEQAVSGACDGIVERARIIKSYGTTPLVSADEFELSLAVRHLLDNARDAIATGAPERNAVEISTHTDAQGRAVVSVRDSGAGIAPAHRPRVFDPFFSTKGMHALGLGLTMVHAYVTSIGGEVSIQSGSTGTTVTIALPPARPRPVEDQPARSSRPARVLVVDDDPSVARAIERTLRPHSVTLTADGASALARIGAGEPFDLVLCDVAMPEVDGIDVFDRARIIAPALASRFVFITGGALTERQSQRLAATGVPVMTKPFDANALRALVEGRICRALADEA